MKLSAKPIRLRRSESVLVVYFAYTTVLALTLPLRGGIAAASIGVNAAVLAGLAILACAEALRGNTIFHIARDWYPLPLILLAYRQMGWFAPAERTYLLERMWVEWDRAILYNWGVKAAIEALGPILPAVLEIAYMLVYSIPVFGVGVLYVYGCRERADRFLFVVLLATLGAYALFPYFPSEPPRTVFPGQDLPAYDTVFRHFNRVLLGGYGIHTSVFPSAHVSSAFASAFELIRLLGEGKWVGRFVLVSAILIAIATFYGRYHYAADAAAGLAMAAAAHIVAVAVERRGASGLRRSV